MAHSFVKRSPFGLLLLSQVLALPSNVIRFTPDAIADITSFNTLSNDTIATAQFHVYDDAFLTILGDTPILSIIVNSTNSSFPQFHEAAVLASNNPPVLFVTSNQYNFTGINSPNTNQKAVSISRVTLDTATQQWSAEVINPTGTTIHLANGGTVGKNGNIIMCAQGDLTNPGGLLQMSATVPFTTTNLINNYLGLPFNSLNDVAVTKDDALWFTDPQFGFLQNIRPAPELPAQIYRWQPNTTNIRVVADGLVAPNGLSFSPDEKVAYLTDTAKNTSNPTAPKTIYAYDVETVSGSVVLANKRVFAMPQSGIPDGIKTDGAGNVYAGCGDGVNVWNPAGVLLGKIIVAGGSSNFALGEGGRVFLLGETKLYLATMSGLTVSKAVDGIA